MINEVLEVEEYLAGKNISKKCLYRICYMLAKWFKQKGMSHIEIRQAIFDWGKKHGVYITYNLNSIIYQALADKHRLRGRTDVWVSDADIAEITSRFDSKNCRKTALGLLCYAKVSADSECRFAVSGIAMANWLGINAGHFSGRYLQELIDFDYVNKVASEKTYSWDNRVRSKSLVLKINVPIENCGKYCLSGNEIDPLYNLVF